MLYAVITGYFAILLLIGWLASRRITTLGDYYVGGKRLGFWVAAFSSRASGESAWLYLGLTGLGAYAGAQALWVVAGEVLGVGAAWFLMAEPFKRATDRFESITVPDYLVSRFCPDTPTSPLAKALRLLAAVALTVFVTIYVSAQIDATGTAFESFLDWNYFAGALFGFLIVAVYTTFGGFVAVAWSDLFQGLLMLVGLVALPIAIWLALPTGAPVRTELAAIQPGFLSLWGPNGFTVMAACVAISYLAIGLGFLGSPQVFVRFISIAGISQVRAGRWVALAFTLLTDGGAVLGGMLGRYLIAPEGGDALFGESGLLGPGGQNILSLTVEHLFPSAIVGVYIAAVLAATMSTIDSLLVVASSAVTRDAYQQVFRPASSPERLARASRYVTLGLAVIALAVAFAVAMLVPGRTIFWFVIFGWSGIAATFCPTIVLALSWPRFNAYAAIATMICGFASVPLFKFVVPQIPVVGLYVAATEELAPSFAIALLVGALVTWWTDGRIQPTRPSGQGP